jgi:hypothetical protein
MLGRAVLFRCVAAVWHGMRILALGGVGGSQPRPPVRRRLWRAVHAPGTALVMTKNVLPAYGRDDMQELRRLVACWLQDVVEEEEEEEEEQLATSSIHDGEVAQKILKFPTCDVLDKPDGHCLHADAELAPVMDDTEPCVQSDGNSAPG